MIRKIAFLLIFSAIAVTGFAFDKSDFNNVLEDLSKGIAQTAYVLSENSESDEREAYETIANQTDRKETRLKELISEIEKPEDFSAAQDLLAEFSSKSASNSHTAAYAQKLLAQRAQFINSNSSEAEKKITVNRNLEMATSPELLMNRRRQRLITIETPIVEAIISLSDTKKNRRRDNLRAIFKRHECRILAENQEEGNDKKINNFYFSGKKYLVDALLDHFGGDLVNSDLKAMVEITCGGFWSGKNSIEVTLNRTRSNSVMGELGFFKSTVEKDPFKYLAANGHLNRLEKIGTYKDVAGVKKLHFNNAVVKIWVTGQNGTKRNAVYKSETDFGDIYLDLNQ
ncbi:MAG: hypothetical protein ACQETH_05680 [Candidatus Rifleibacteriota bacterium]